MNRIEVTNFSNGETRYSSFTLSLGSLRISRNMDSADSWVYPLLGMIKEFQKLPSPRQTGTVHHEGLPYPREGSHSAIRNLTDKESEKILAFLKTAHELHKNAVAQIVEEETKAADENPIKVWDLPTRMKVAGNSPEAIAYRVKKRLYRYNGEWKVPAPVCELA